MSLIDFVALEQVQERFKTEFKPAYQEKHRIRFYRKSQSEDNVLRENIGIYIGVFDGYAKVICDSFGRKKEISSIEDLIRFFTDSKYGSNLCWFYNDSTAVSTTYKLSISKKFYQKEK